MLYNWLLLIPLAGLAFVQNMAFTWSSRSRNSGNPDYHRKAAWCSNGVWFITTVVIFNQLWKTLTTGNWPLIVATGVVYVLATTEGSVRAMRILLKREKGAEKVGARG